VKAKIISGFFLAVLCFSFTAFAQNHRGAVRGRITDPQGAIIAGAQVKLVQEDTNETRTATSDARGDYVFTLIRPGAYRLEVSHSGFQKSGDNLVVRVNQEARLDVTLYVAGTSVDPIVVTDAASPLKHDASLGATIDNRQVTGLPLDGRNFLELSLLAPGAAPAAQGSAGSVRGDFAFSMNGSREDANNFLLDGVYNVDPKLNTFGVKPPVDAIQEFEVLSSAYDASFGRSAGAQINVVLKSGTNGFHGTAYQFLRNQVFDARNYFAPADQPDPKYRRNQFGFSFGGPIVKNKTFFFGDYEGARLREGITRLANVPTARERVGDFSQLPPSQQPLIPGANFPFPGGQIPQQALNPIGLKIAALYPLPNRNVPGQNYAASPVQRDRNDLFDVRIDHSFSSASQFAARYSFSDRNLFEPYSGVTQVFVPGYGNSVLRRGQNLMLSETHVFSPRLINDARVAFSRVGNQVQIENPGVSVNQQVGLPELSNNPRDFGLSFIRVTGYSPLGHEYNNPQDSATNVFQFLDTATYSRGAHLLKFGFDFRYTQQNAFRDVQSRGLLTFPGQVSFTLPDGTPTVFPFITGNPLANLLLGLPLVSGGARLDNHQHLRTESYNLFANDSFRITPRLTLSAGLRYEYNSPPVDATDRANIYDPATGKLVQVGTGGIPRAGYETDKNNFAPRVGLAWALGKDSATVVRAGYGVYYDQSPLAPGEGLFFNAPYFDCRFYFQSQQAPLTLFNPFPFNTPGHSPQSAFAFERNLRPSYTQHWNLNV